MSLVLILTFIWVLCIILAFTQESDTVLWFISLTFSIIGVVFIPAIMATYPMKTISSDIKPDYIAIGKGIATIKIGDDETIFTDYNTVTNIKDTSTFIKKEGFNIFDYSVNRKYELKK